MDDVVSHTPGHEKDVRELFHLRKKSYTRGALKERRGLEQRRKPVAPYAPRRRKAQKAQKRDREWKTNERE
jgi:hypothetical protein